MFKLLVGTFGISGSSGETRGETRARGTTGRGFARNPAGRAARAAARGRR